MVACKWQKIQASQRVANNPCPNINAGLLLVSAQYISGLTHKLNVSGHLLM
jgi:hypothetical protein